MIAKLICHGATRDEAIARMREALNAFHIAGVSSNIPFQAALMQHPRFVSGVFTTGFIAEEYPEGFQGADLPEDALRDLAALAVHVHVVAEARAAKISGAMPYHQRHIQFRHSRRGGQSDLCSSSIANRAR